MVPIDENAIPEHDRIPRVVSATWKYETGAVGSLTHALVLQGTKYSCELEVCKSRQRSRSHMREDRARAHAAEGFLFFFLALFPVPFFKTPTVTNSSSSILTTRPNFASVRPPVTTSKSSRYVPLALSGPLSGIPRDAFQRLMFSNPSLTSCDSSETMTLTPPSSVSLCSQSLSDTSVPSTDLFAHRTQMLSSTRRNRLSVRDLPSPTTTRTTSCLRTKTPARPMPCQ